MDDAKTPTGLDHAPSYRSAEIATILNRLDHCASYSYSLELKSAAFNTITNREGLLPLSIQVKGSEVTHLCWDNLDPTVETPTGAGAIHFAHGLVIQEVSINTASRQRVAENSCVPRTKGRSVSYISLLCQSKSRTCNNIVFGQLFPRRRE